MPDLRTVLIVQHGSNRDGSSLSGLLLADGLREAGWVTHVVFGFYGPIIGDYEAAGHLTYIVPHKNWLRRSRSHQFLKDVFHEWRNAFAFQALFERIDPDVVYINTSVSLAGAIAARRKGLPLIWHLREMFSNVGGEMYAPGWAVPLVRNTIVGGGTCTVANSTATAYNMLGEKAEQHIMIVPNAVRSAFFNERRSQQEARTHLGLPLDATIVGVPGTLRPMKGHLFFLRAVASILLGRPTWSVAVTGGTNGAYARQIVDEASALGLGAHVHFLGWVDDMPAFYRACDAVCVPSRAEPFGRTVIEGFASCTPVIATAVGGMKEIIDSGETGLLVPYDDDKALSSSIVRLLDNPPLRQEISMKARQVAEEKYHETVYKQRIVQVVNEVVGTASLMQ